MGRPPKPASLKLLTGNPGHRRIKREPAAPKGLPPAPRRLAADVRAAWRDLSADLARLGVLQVVDRHAVELAAHHLARRRRLAVFLVEHGETYETTTVQGSTMRRARPEVAMLGASDGFLAAFFRECGLTPTARARLGVPAETPRSASWLPPELRRDDPADGDFA